MFKGIKHNKKRNKSTVNSSSDNNPSEVIGYDLHENIQKIKRVFLNDDTLIFREFRNQKEKSIKCYIIFIDGASDRNLMDKNIINPIIYNKNLQNELNDSLIEELIQNTIISHHIIRESNITKIVNHIINGRTLLLVNKINEGIIVSTEGWESRAITEPNTERVVRGPKEGFTEALVTNLTLIRRKLKTTNLKFEFKNIGKVSKTQISICYIDNLVDKNILKELNKRLDDIKIDGILDSGYIQEFISDFPTSPFKTVGDTERPDIVAGKLLEGRIAIIVDGSPFVLTVPYIFIEYYQSNEDYYGGFLWGSINRLLRITGWFITISLAPIYIALITFHQEMIPTPLLLSVSSSRNGVPFPTIVEAIGLLFVFEVLRETGIRMPEPIGQTVSIVGALVLGQAAVDARLVSAPMIIVIAFTGITSLINHKLLTASVIMRLSLILLSSSLGLYGYIFGVIGMLIHLMSIRSFGVSYMNHTRILDSNGMRDSIIRAPWWYMDYRRQKTG